MWWLAFQLQAIDSTIEQFNELCNFPRHTALFITVVAQSVPSFGRPLDSDQLPSERTIKGYPIERLRPPALAMSIICYCSFDPG